MHRLSKVCKIPLAGIAAVLLGMLAPLMASARGDGEAIVGRPFGVARVTLSAAELGGATEDGRILLTEKEGRVFYPAVTVGRFGKLIGKLLGDGKELPIGNVTIHFLFVGDAPLRLTLLTPNPLEIGLNPRPAADRERGRLLEQWWKEYNAAAKAQLKGGDHPPLVQHYLLAMLSQRMGLPLPADSLPAQTSSQTRRSLELLTGMEGVRNETLHNTMVGRGDFGQPADQPVPPEPTWPPLPLPTVPAEVAVEPISLHVPQECFYVRFGRFSNYVWMNKLTEEYGGDISSMVTLRSYVQPLSARVQQQLGLEQSKLGELLGDTVIADVALIGRDTYVNEGAAMGILFQARNGLLGNDLTQQRKRALEREKANGATPETLKIAGHEVSFYSTPDNRFRSFYAVDGDFHLVTTSKAIVERFFAAGQGKDSLGKSEEFRFARAEMPLSREDTIFVYMSAPFFQGLLSPQYQIELARRMQAVTDIELSLLARLAAKGEGSAAESLEDLAAGGYLPHGFGRRPDGSGPLLAGDSLLDSRRGARGAFIPIPDVSLTGVTAAEATRYTTLAQAYAQEWKRLDPLQIGLKRFLLDPKTNVERITIDAAINPLDDAKYGKVLSMLGPPTTEMITTAPGDMINFQAALKGGAILPTIPPHHLFLGVQDLPPAGNLAPHGFLQTLQLLRTTPGYLGSWPKAGFLDMLPFGLGGQPDQYGFARMPLGLWRREGAGFSVMSFDPQLLAEVTPHLRPVQGEKPAQVRLHAGDLSKAKFADFINSLYYQRASQASVGNVRLLNILQQQLHVPASDCRAVAERLLDAKLRCPLGGDYRVVEGKQGGVWQATAAQPPAGKDSTPPYHAPLNDWFRGLDASLVKLDDRILAHAELDMQRKAVEATKIELPLFNLFGGQSALKTKPKPAGAEELPLPLPRVPKEAIPQEPGMRDLPKKAREF